MNRNRVVACIKTGYPANCCLYILRTTIIAGYRLPSHFFNTGRFTSLAQLQFLELFWWHLPHGRSFVLVCQALAKGRFTNHFFPVPRQSIVCPCAIQVVSQTGKCWVVAISSLACCTWAYPKHQNSRLRFRKHEGGKLLKWHEDFHRFGWKWGKKNAFT